MEKVQINNLRAIPTSSCDAVRAFNEANRLKEGEKDEIDNQSTTPKEENKKEKKNQPKGGNNNTAMKEKYGNQKKGGKNEETSANGNSVFFTFVDLGFTKWNKGLELLRLRLDVDMYYSFNIKTEIKDQRSIILGH